MSIGPAEIVIVLIIALLVFGPKRLPQMGKSLGKGVREFRKAAETAKTELGLGEVTDQINEVKATFTEPLKDVTGTFTDLKSSVDLKSAIEAPVAAEEPRRPASLELRRPSATVDEAPAAESPTPVAGAIVEGPETPAVTPQTVFADVPRSPAPPEGPPPKRPPRRPRRRPRQSRRRAPWPPARRRVPRPEPDRVALTAEERLTLFEHLDELRKRLFVCLIAATVGVLVAALFNSFMFDAAAVPAAPGRRPPRVGHQDHHLQPGRAVHGQPQGVGRRRPHPGRRRSSSTSSGRSWRRRSPPARRSTSTRWCSPRRRCSSWASRSRYFLVLPKGLAFLLTFSAGYFNVQLRASDYFTFMALFILAFGVVFELPVVLVLLAKVGVIDDKFLRKNRRWAIVALAFAAAIITPSQDAFSMLAMFLPLYVLYEVSIVLARFVQPKREADAAVEDSSGGGDDSASRAPA